MAKVQNREKLLRKLAALPQKVRDQVGPAIKQGADEIVAMQKRLSHSRRVADSIQAVKGNVSTRTSGSLSAGGVKGDPDLTVTITAGSEEAYWARWQEFGTAPHKVGGKFEGADHPGTAAMPFFYPPVRALRRRVKSRITRATKKAAREVASQ